MYRSPLERRRVVPFYMLVSHWTMVDGQRSVVYIHPYISTGTKGSQNYTSTRMNPNKKGEKKMKTLDRFSTEAARHTATTTDSSCTTKLKLSSLLALIFFASTSATINAGEHSPVTPSAPPQHRSFRFERN